MARKPKEPEPEPQADLNDKPKEPVNEVNDHYHFNFPFTMHVSPCPRCGYCPTCGGSGYPLYPSIIYGTSTVGTAGMSMQVNYTSGN